MAILARVPLRWSVPGESSVAALRVCASAKGLAWHPAPCIEGLQRGLNGEDVGAEPRPLLSATSRPGLCVCLTFEVRRDRRCGARPARPMICPTASRAWCHAVGPRLDRGVRRQLAQKFLGLKSHSGWAPSYPSMMMRSIVDTGCLSGSMAWYSGEFQQSSAA